MNNLNMTSFYSRGYEQTEIKTISSIEVAEMMGKEHYEILQYLEGRKDKDGKTLVTGIIPTLETEGLQYQKYFIPSTYKAGTREYKCYLVTKMGCELLGNKQQGEKGILFTAKYVERFNQMEKAIQERDEKASLLLAIYEGGQLGVSASKQLVKIETKGLQEQIEEQAPKVAFAEAVGECSTLISIAELATLISQNGVDIGRNRLFDWLRANGYLVKQNGPRRNLPTQRAIDLGVLKMIEDPAKDYHGNPVINKVTMVTPKGQQYFLKKFLFEHKKGA